VIRGDGAMIPGPVPSGPADLASWSSRAGVAWRSAGRSRAPQWVQNRGAPSAGRPHRVQKFTCAPQG